MRPVPGTITDPRVTRELDSPRVQRLDRQIRELEQRLKVLREIRRAAASRL